MNHSSWVWNIDRQENQQDGFNHFTSRYIQVAHPTFYTSHSVSKTIFITRVHNIVQQVCKMSHLSWMWHIDARVNRVHQRHWTKWFILHTRVGPGTFYNECTYNTIVYTKNKRDIGIRNLSRENVNRSFYTLVCWMITLPTGICLQIQIWLLKWVILCTSV